MKKLLTFIAAASFTVLVGTVTDQTTGQPLVGVQVTAVAGKPVSAKTDANGHFSLTVPAGRYVLHYTSNDVPPQQTTVVVHGSRQTIRLEACSTTLDYSCAGVSPGGS